jgi:RNA polymerase sigma factor (sigma-70 family)
MTTLVTDSASKTPARLASSAILACQPDQRLVKLARAGHERAFDAIVERYRGQLTHYCRRILPESRAEDAVQQAFINAHAALRRSDEPLQLKAWLFAITRNAALNMLRQNGWNYEQIPLDFDGVRRPDQVVEQRIELAQTVAALNELPERQRDALVMRELEGRSYDEIALALGANDGAVRQLLNRARVTLRHAASALIPPPLVARAAASMPPSDGRRIAEIVGGLGAAGVAKAGATALVAGSLVVGLVEAPPLIGHKTTHHVVPSTRTSARASRSAPTHDTPVALNAGQLAEGSGHGRGGGRGSGSDDSGSRHPGSGHDGSSGRSGSDDSGHSSRGDDSSGSGGSHSGSGSGGSGSSGGSGTSGGSGSDDVVARTESTNSSGTSGSGGGPGSASSSGSGQSGSSGSGSSGSGSSGSGTSGSGSLPSVTSGSDSSGSGSTGSDDAVDH